MMDRIHVINPWTGAWSEIDPREITRERLDGMAVFMDDDIREQIHREGADTPGEFFRRYVELVGPEAAGHAWFS